MNKLFKIVSHILFFINVIILFSCYLHVLDFSFIKLTLCSIVVLVLLMIDIVQLRRKNNILNDKKYNIMFILVNIMVLIIFLRDKFDPLIPLGSAMDVDNNIQYNPSSSGAFTDYNTIFITIMYAGILAYNLLNKDKIKKEKSL